MTTSIGQTQAFRWRDLVSGRLLVLAGLTASGYVVLVAVFAHILLSPTGKDDQYAVVLPPWFDYRQAVALAASADALIIDMNDTTRIALIYAKRPDAVDAIHRAGAWMVLDPGRLGDLGLRGLCTSVPNR